MSKQGNNSNAVSSDSPPASRYPGMIRGGHMGGGGGGGANVNNVQMQSYGGHFSAGNRPMGPRPINMGQSSPIIGQKRDSSGFSVTGGPNFSPRQAGVSQDSGDTGNFAKLFVGSVPRTVTEDDIHPLFAEHGNVLEVALIKDKRTGQQQGCCFIKYATVEEADRAIRALHNQRTLPGGLGPIQVRYADGERERLVEYKLFVGSLNKQASEKEIEEIFAPYGRVDDVYIMRDEQKQSRGCAFVKYPSREMAMAAMNGLSGKYTMKGCDQPLTVRFADPKRPKLGDTRVGPAYGGPGFSSRPQGQLGVRPSSGSGGHMGGRGPPTNWRPMGTPNMGALSQVGTHPYGSPLTPRGSAAGAPSAMGGTIGGPGGSINGSVMGAGIGTPPSQHQSFNQPLAQQQIQAYGQQPTPLQKPPQLQQQLPPPMQHQHQQPPQSYSQVQQSQQALQQFGQHPQSSLPNVQQHSSLGQLSSSQQSLPLYSQLPVSQPQVQPHITPVLQHAPPSLQQQQQHLPIAVLQQQQQMPQSQAQLQPQAQQQQQMQPQQQQQPQPQSQQQNLPISMQQQGLSTQSSFPSQQYPYLQQQHQMHMMQPVAQSQHQQQPLHPQKQQTYYQVASAQPVQQEPSWAIPTQSQTAATTPAIVSAPLASSALTATSVVAASSAPNPPAASCNWTEHTSPEGYKYYYNSVSGESKWEKPEEFAAFEKQQQQQPVPQQAQAQVQSQPQVQAQSINQAQQLQHQTQQQQQQPQLQQPTLTTPYSGSPMLAQRPVQNLGYGLQGLNTNLEASRHQVQQQPGMPRMQDFLWKPKPAGT